MSGGPVGKFFSFLKNTFPERQIFLRTNGDVSYLSLGTGVQAGLSLAIAGFFAWVAYASLNLVFKDQIIEAKDQSLAQMHQHVRDLNGEMDRLQARFIAKTEGLESNHQSLSDMVSWQNTIVDRLNNIRSAMGPDYSGGSAVQHKEGVKAPIPGAKPNDFIGTGGPEEGPVNEGVDKSPENGGEGEDSVLEQGAFLLKDFFTETLDFEDDDHSDEFAEEVNRLESRLAALKFSQVDLLDHLEASTRNHTIELENIISLTGLPVDDVLDRVEPTTIAHVGGPYIPLESAAELTGDTDVARPDAQRLTALIGGMERMSHLQDAVSSMPLVTPVDEYRFTDRFGPRSDPFSRKTAFHSGLDLASKRNTPIKTPLDGIVVFAGYNGAYGRMVEIDHGNGFTTRYGHMRKILVKKGQKVSFRDEIGLMGSSGRSTGTHLHYEIWFDGKVRDPQPFLNAGRYVFEG